MATAYETEVLSQNSIYNRTENTIKDNRKLKVYFSIPQKGTNEDTGLLLFIAGFGGHANSNVYKKMRDEFSDKYNLVTIQCDYFGYEFMQSANNIRVPGIDKEKLSEVFTLDEVEQIYKSGKLDFNEFLNIGSKYSINVEVNADMSENIQNFNDMGIIQSIDNITSVLNVMNVLYNNEYCFNSKKVIIYGHSHGAYLSYLCNAFAPSLFSLIIDNSGWLHPVYLTNNNMRYLHDKIGNLTLITKFDYLAKNIIDDKEILNLCNLYSNFKNKCTVVSYHGTTDNLISCKEKAKFCKSIDKCIYKEISEEKIDNVVFKSTNHGLDSDFIEMFDYTMNEFSMEFEKDTKLDLQNEVIFETFRHKYVINYENIIPEIKII